MPKPPSRPAADLAWASRVAQVITNALVDAKALLPEQSNRAAEIAMHAIFKVLASGDRP